MLENAEKKMHIDDQRVSESARGGSEIAKSEHIFLYFNKIKNEQLTASFSRYQKNATAQ